MNSTSRLLGCIVTVASIAALIASDSHAQCPAARSFGTFPGGKVGSQILIDASAFQNNSNELAQFWETGNPAAGTGVGAAGTCPSQDPVVGWWQLAGTTDLRGIRGFVSQPGCTLQACPAVGAFLTFLIEDQTADGSNAGFIAYSADETPAGARWWDLARTDPNATPGSTLIHVMDSYPSVVIVGSAGTPPITTVTNDYPEDAGILFHGVQLPDSTPLLASSQLDSYDVMSFNGTADPGRARSLWTLEKKIVYHDAAIFADSISVPCPTDQTTVFAIGLTWDGGVESELVGPASLPVLCNPNIAEPDADTPKVHRPSITRSPGQTR